MQNPEPKLKQLKQTRGRLPHWLKGNLPTHSEVGKISQELRKHHLHTVCEAAKCPNRTECWSDRTATLMVLGDTCTRACRFCHVKTGNPGGKVDFQEIENATKMVGLMNLRYIVLTSVDRDDLSDHGAGHFAAIVKAIKNKYPQTMVETLIPDFNGIEEHMHTLAQSSPFVIAQNMETIERLTKRVRDPRAGYEKSLRCLRFYKTFYPHISTKTSLMVGLGESRAELRVCMQEIRQAGVDIITFGQYLQPSVWQLPVEKYYHPKEFDELKSEALSVGFKFVASGPMVRSSYKAAEYLDFMEEHQ